MNNLATPARRLGASILDGIANILIFFIMFSIKSNSKSIIFILAIIFYGYLWSRGSSPGKLVLEMTVIKKDSGNTAGFFTMLLRETIGKFLSGLIFSLGFIWILLDKDNQGWHDKFVNTIVVSNKN